MKLNLLVFFTSDITNNYVVYYDLFGLAKEIESLNENDNENQNDDADKTENEVENENVNDESDDNFAERRILN